MDFEKKVEYCADWWYNETDGACVTKIIAEDVDETSKECIQPGELLSGFGVFLGKGEKEYV